MKKYMLAFAFAFTFVSLQAQQSDTLDQTYINTAQRMLQQKGRLTIGGYGNVDYNQPLNSNIRQNGNLDVHRLVMLFGYHFNKKTSLITEIEYEHVEEVYIEQAFLDYRMNQKMTLRGGLILVPMGIINEYHEPTTFNGVERPRIDKYLAPTTWREIGAGIHGNLPSLTMRYQAYLVNGFNGYDGSAHLSGQYGLRKGRQKGAESFASAPNFTGKIEYYGILGLNIGLSGYFGKTQSTLYNGINKGNEMALEKADSSDVGVSMLGLDVRYQTRGMQLKGQLYYTSLSGTNEYNEFTATNGIPNNLGSSMYGYYAEVGYDLLYTNRNTRSQLIPFVRYSNYDTQHKMAEGFTENDVFDRTAITTGLTWKITRGSAVKADMQFLKSEADKNFST